MPKGTIQSYDPDEKRGEITPEEGGEAVAFSHDAVEDARGGDPRIGEEVTYRLDESSDSPEALDIRRAGPQGYT